MVLRLRDKGKQRVRVPIRVHVAATGGSNSYPYTCQGDTVYDSHALIEAEPQRGGWQIRLTPAKSLKPGPPSCSDPVAQNTFQWPTGSEVHIDDARATPAHGQERAPRDSSVDPRGTATTDCTEIPGVTHQCTERLGWTGTLKPDASLSDSVTGSRSSRSRRAPQRPAASKRLISAAAWRTIDWRSLWLCELRAAKCRESTYPASRWFQTTAT